MISDLTIRIARCEKCSSGPIVPDWLPISYFGDYENTNAWVLTINPSSREFVDRDGGPLRGGRQRFRRLSDFPEAGERHALTHHQQRGVLDYQDSYFTRPGVAYQPFFNRLGRFLCAIHEAGIPEDPLVPFKDGVRASWGDTFRYAHLDIVKCATDRPWTLLSGVERRQLLRNCAGYLGEQLRGQHGLRIVLINGRTAFEQCSTFLAERMGYEPQEHQLDMGGFSSKVWGGAIRVDGHDVVIVGWSPNVVNGHLRKSQTEQLARAVRLELSGVLMRE